MRGLSCCACDANSKSVALRASIDVTDIQKDESDIFADGSPITPPGPEDGAISKKYPDGTKFTGEMVNGRREGHGVWVSPDGLYEGQWRNGWQDGQGRQQWTDGRTYEGQYRDGLFHGGGKMVWPSDAQGAGSQTYDGNYVNNLKHGEGTFTWPDGRMYRGNWLKGQPSGEGTFTNPEGWITSCNKQFSLEWISRYASRTSLSSKLSL